MRAEPPLSREDIAKIEIGETAITPGLVRFLLGVFVALLAAVPTFELSRAAAGDEAARRPWTTLAGIPSAAAAAWHASDGRWSSTIAANRAALERLHEFEQAIEDESRLGRTLRPPAQELLAARFGAGNEQVYMGRDGWLFYRRDVDYVLGPPFLREDVRSRRVRAASEWETPPQPDPRPAMVGFRDHLRARGIALILVPVPVKPTIHPEKLRAGLETTPRNGSETALLEELRAAGITILDTTGILAAAHRSSGASQYLATDTHWRPEAMETIAADLANLVRGTARLTEGSAIQQTESRDVSHRGDVFAMLDLAPSQRRFAAETVTVRRVLQQDGSPWRPSREAEVLVLGDSFSNIYSLESMGWGTSAGLVEHLSLALQLPVDRIVQNDAGAYATRELLLRDGDERLRGKKVVVWQFASREFASGDWRLLR